MKKMTMIKVKRKNKKQVKELKLIVYNKLAQLNQLCPVKLLDYDRPMLFIDIETIGDMRKGETIFPYDISYNIVQMVQGKLKVIEKQTMVIGDIYYNKYLMENAFYGKKRPKYNHYLNHYNTDKKCKFFKVFNAIEALEKLNSLIKKHNITIFGAFNVEFDYNGITNLYNANAKVKNGIKKLYRFDIMVLMAQYFLDFPKELDKFINWCLIHDRKTDKNNCLFTVENIVAFLTNNPEFEEQHLGLFDLENELFIVNKIIQKYRRNNLSIDYKLNSIKKDISYYLYRGKTPLLSLKEFLN
jgi:hypothetical protein